MAWSTVETTIANPARRAAGKKKAVARKKLSAKQIKFFGSARQKAALKASRKRKTKVKAKRHTARTRPNPSKKRATARKSSTTRKRPVKRAKARERSNPGEIISLVLGNPAKRSKQAMATKAKKRASARRSNNAGRPAKRRTTKRVSHRRRSNPGPIGSPKTWLMGGAGVLAGVFVSRGAPQLLLGSKNTGPMGYLANAAAAAGAGFAAHTVLKNPTFTASVVAGGFAALIARVISDYTPYGATLALSGWGDYQFSNIVGTVPQRLVSRDRAVTEWGGPAPAGIGTPGGGDLGVMAGNC